MKHPLVIVQLFKRSSALRYLSLRDIVTPFVGYRVIGYSGCLLYHYFYEECSVHAGREGL